MQIETKRGGARKGAGRKAGEPQTTISFRILKSKKKMLQEKFGRTLNKKVLDFFSEILL